MLPLAAASPNPTGLRWVAILLAAAGAAGYALGARAQNRAVPGGGGRLPVRQVLRLLGNRGWLAGLALLGAGTALHVLALSMAPLTVVQPVGVLALPLTAAFDAASRRTRLSRTSVLAVAACTGGVGLFVVLAATTTAAAPATRNDVLEILGLLAATLVVLAVGALLAKGRLRSLMQTVAAGACFGFVAALTKVALTHLTAADAPGVLLALPGLVVALLVGGWYAQQAHANAPTEVVVAGLTVVDPLVAVGIGVAVLGEAANATPAVTAALLACGVFAVAGVIGLSRHRAATPPLTSPGRCGGREELPAGRLRILLAADTYPPDVNGAARFTQRLAAGLASRGHEVHVLCPAPAPGPSLFPELVGGVGGLVVHRLASHGVGVHPTFRVCLPWRIARPVAELIGTIAPDVVHTQSHFIVGREVIRSAVRQRVPVIATNHFMPENLLAYTRIPVWLHATAARLAWRDLHRVYARVHAVTAPTPRAAALLHQTGFHRPVQAISCGIDLTRYQQACAAPATHLTVLFVGRLDVEKRVDELVTAMTLLPPDLPARLEIVGTGSQHTRLHALAHRLGLHQQVRFHGLVGEPALLDAYARCTVFCMPGTAELQSLATMEAMAAGKPVVAADAMALPHLVHDGVNGWLYPPGDPAALAERLTRVLTQPETTRAAMGAASREIVTRHDIATTLATFESLYRAALHPRVADPIEGRVA